METSPLFPEEPEQTLSAPVSHASRTRAPGSDWARRMTAHSGRSLFELLPETGPLGSCLRTLLGSSKWRSAACWLTWKAKGTKLRRLYFQLAPSTPRTGATGYGLLPTMRAALTGKITPRRALDLNPNLESVLARQLWPTPLASNANGPQISTNKGGLKLQSAVLLYPTPRASENENRQTKLTPSQMAGRRGLNLASVANLFPTPTARDWKDGTAQSCANVPINGLLGRAVHALPAPIMRPNAAGSLNPDWVGLLMGYEEHWTNLEQKQEEREWIQIS